MLSRLPHDVIHDLLSRLPTPTLVAIGCCTRNLHQAANAIIGHRTDRELLPYMICWADGSFIDPHHTLQLFREQLAITGAIITSWTALKIVDPDSLLYAPAELNICVPFLSELPWMRWISLNLDYNFAGCKPLRGDGQRGLSLATFESRMDNSRIIQIIGSSKTTSLYPVFTQPVTNLMNIVTAEGIICPYPKLAMRRESLYSSDILRKRPTRLFAQFIETLSEIRETTTYQYPVDPASHTDATRCTCTPYCIQEARLTNDLRNMRWINPNCNIRSTGLYTQIVKWRLGGNACKDKADDTWTRFLHTTTE